MIVKHAPYAIFGDLVIAYARTTKTACSRRVETVKLASRDDTNCPECIKAIEADRAQFREMEEAAKRLGLM